MRTDIYYWKCDSPLTDEAKRRTYFKEKYAQTDLTRLVLAACDEALGPGTRTVTPCGADGNHFAFIVRDAAADGGTWFFRADDGQGDDEYMAAESRLMRLAAAHGVPVPTVYHTDMSLARWPVRFQIMECRPEPCLNEHQRAGTLATTTVAADLGRQLRQMHRIALPGYGFMNTERLRMTPTPPPGALTDDGLVGLDGTYGDYFFRRLDEHLGYLRDAAFLTGAEVTAIATRLEQHAGALAGRPGVLVHRDLALWNVLGTPQAITAIIDWDDAVSGDAADDLGMLHCFYDDAFMTPLLFAYVAAGVDGEADDAIGDDFARRVWLHMLRNMLWKFKLRHSLGYFDRDASFFLNTRTGDESLEHITRRKVAQAMRQLERCDR